VAPDWDQKNVSRHFPLVLLEATLMPSERQTLEQEIRALKQAKIPQFPFVKAAEVHNRAALP